MKRILLLAVMVTALLLASCGDNSSPQKGGTSTEVLKNAVDALSSINSFHYTHYDEQILDFQTHTSSAIMISEIKRVSKPLAIWAHTTHKNLYSNSQAKDSEAAMESYQGITDDGKGWVVYFRGENEEWQKNMVEDEEQAGTFIENVQNSMKSSQYLLNENLSSFKISGKEDGRIKYSGGISRDSIVEAYKQYARDFYAFGGMVRRDENLSNKELLEEITGGKVYELMVGMPSLAFSAEPTPVTVWVDEKKNVIVKVEIDRIKATQAMVATIFEETEDSAPKVEKAVSIYELVEFDTFNEIPMPE